MEGGKHRRAGGHCGDFITCSWAASAPDVRWSPLPHPAYVTATGHHRVTGVRGKFTADTCHRGARSRYRRVGVHALIGPLPRKGTLHPQALRLVHRDCDAGDCSPLSAQLPAEAPDPR